jgi:hypothetical protein
MKSGGRAGEDIIVVAKSNVFFTPHPLPASGARDKGKIFGR